MNERIFVGMGSNLKEPIIQIENALEYLKRHPNIQVKAISSLYRSKPMDGPAQPDYINAVVELKTDLDPDSLLTILQKIEIDQGRERLIKNGPRTLDLDLLFYGERIIQTERLILPHPRLKLRDFVLVPLHEIAPEWQAHLIAPNENNLVPLKHINLN